MSGLVGIDFGTTNSVIALVLPGGGTRAATFGAMPQGSTQGSTGGSAGGGAATFRSVLCFSQPGGRGAVRHAAGPAAVEAYLDDPLDSRLLLSMKSYLAQSSFRETRVFGRPWTLEALIALFLRELLAAAGLDPAQVHVTAGRPVQFAGDFPDDALGEARLRAAFAAAGFASLGLAMEPEGAGHRFASTLDAPATVLIGDFGGGTSDFSVLRFDPGGARRGAQGGAQGDAQGDAQGGARRIAPLGHAGIGIAGDSLDYRIIDRVIAPRLGKGSTYTVMGGAPLPVPAEWYAGFARWHRLSLMRTPRTLRAIEEVARTASHPERLRDLIALLEDEQGYPLYQAVSAAKAALSSAESTVLRFRHGTLDIEQTITRAEFEGWIADELRRLDATVGQALAAAGLDESGIDRVFLTGGTALVPAVRGLFERRFGAERIAGGGEFLSVAEGLALIGAERARG
ncbi:Hsp70 family protein [Roseomonas sp. NAR14]|uniref:Hsp70 family protein n=1 Tax=Roseomonas acroporae TaxID=2937791 RepID=A0A9X2BX09_9PROT|nr:Hsp70 family protein [Roseomonas acroporae]MCK8784485.1 Hsp70 family protein [Roseomonas acroporae]